MDAAIPQSPWLPLRDAAGYAHRGKRFLAAEVKAGRLRAARIGGRGEILTRREWLDEWIEAQAAGVLAARRNDPAGDPLGPSAYVFGDEVGRRMRP